MSALGRSAVLCPSLHTKEFTLHFSYQFVWCRCRKGHNAAKHVLAGEIQIQAVASMHSLELLQVSMSVGVMMGSIAYAIEPKDATTAKSSNSGRIVAARSSKRCCLQQFSHK